MIAYIFNIFSIFVKMAKNPKIGRRFQIENIIDKNEIKLARIMQTNLMEQLQLCAVTSSLQNLFARPATSFKLFCPTLAKVNSKQENTKETAKRSLTMSNTNEPNKKRCVGTIINNTGQRITMPKGLSKKYCSDFLDTGKFCQHGEACSFVHAIFPSGFSDADKDIMTKHVNETEGLSFQKKCEWKKRRINYSQSMDLEMA